MYAPPEANRGTHSFDGDVYSWACSVCHAATGLMPFNHASIEEQDNDDQDNPYKLSTLTATGRLTHEMCQTLVKCFEFQRKKRPSVRHLMEVFSEERNNPSDVEPMSSPATTTVPQTQPEVRPRMPRLSSTLVIAAVVFVAVLMATVLVSSDTSFEEEVTINTTTVDGGVRTRPLFRPPQPPFPTAANEGENPNNYRYEKTGGGNDWKGKRKPRKYELWFGGKQVNEFSDRRDHHVALEKAKSWVDGQTTIHRDRRLEDDFKAYEKWRKNVEELQAEHDRRYPPSEFIPPPRPPPPIPDGRADPKNYKLIGTGGGNTIVGGRKPRTCEVWYNGQLLITKSHSKDHHIAEEEAQRFVDAEVESFQAAHLTRLEKMEEDYEAEVREKRAEFDAKINQSGE